MSSVVSKRATYNYQTLRPQLFEMLEAIGASSIEKGARVVIKPNLLAPALPRQQC